MASNAGDRNGGGGNGGGSNGGGNGNNGGNFHGWVANRDNGRQSFFPSDYGEVFSNRPPPTHNKRSSASFQARGAAKKAKLVEKFDSCKASIKKVEAEVAKKQALVDLLELEKKNEELTAQLAALNADRAAKIEEPKK